MKLASLAAFLCPVAYAFPDFILTEDVNVLKTSNRYIVTLHDDANAPKHMAELDMHLETQDMTTMGLGGVLYKYKMSKFRGYAGQFSAATVARLRNSPDVAHVESDYAWTLPSPDGPGTLFERPVKDFRVKLGKPKEMINQTDAPYGLHDISHRGEEDPGVYWYDSSAGQGTYGYVIDSGIKIDHSEFEGRASLGHNAVKNALFRDDNGHGTHVASTLCGKTWGVAKKCNLIAVKVSKRGVQYTSTTIAGFAWAAKDIRKKCRQSKAVINISSSGQYSVAYNRAIDAAAAWGVSTVVSAGNNGKEYTGSPASSSLVVAVGATDADRKRAKFSNWGKNVTMYAPGVAIPGAWIGLVGRSTTASIKYSGTSMSSPHVAGLMLYFKALRWLPGARLTKWHLLKTATQGVVKNVDEGPNLLAYNESGK